jgi:hypothetical protein
MPPPSAGGAAAAAAGRDPPAKRGKQAAVAAAPRRGDKDATSGRAALPAPSEGFQCASSLRAPTGEHPQRERERERERGRVRVDLVDSHGRWKRPCLQTIHACDQVAPVTVEYRALDLEVRRPYSVVGRLRCGGATQLLLHRRCAPQQVSTHRPRQIERVGTWGAHTGGGNALAFKQPT